MKTNPFHRIFYREVTGPFVIALLVLTFVVFTREFGRLAELLIRRNADGVTIAKIVLFILPNVLVFSIPFSFLIGALIGLSRLSSDSEIIALRANGVSISQMLLPVLKIGATICLITGAFTLFLLPEGNWNLRIISHELGFKPIQSELKPRVFNEEIPHSILYVEDVDLRTQAWKGVLVHTTDESGLKRTALAERGEMYTSGDGRTLQLHLENGTVYETNQNQPLNDKVTRFVTQDLRLQMEGTEQAFAKPKRPKDKDIRELTWDRHKGTPEEQRTNSAEWHGRLALPLSTLIFAVLAVTLGISTPRGGRGYGFLTSLIVAFIYFVFFDMGKKLGSDGVIPAWLGGWGADLILAAIACFSFVAATRSWSVFQFFRENRVFASIGALAGRIAGILGRTWRGLMGTVGKGFWSFCTVCVQFTRVVDLYMIRTFVYYLVPTLLVCASLFYLFTFFELMDDIFANNIPYRQVFDYFFYLFPQVLILLVPISILIATLVSFGVLDKTSQVVAFKSCGVSVYRLSAPIMILAALLGFGLFVLEEYVAPYANQRQDYLRNVIKGRPVQTFYQREQNWIFGEGKRLYNYRHFDSERDRFADISIYDLDISENRLTRHIYAKRAQWDPTSKSWILNEGWERTFGNEVGGYEGFTERRVKFEPPSHFEQEVKQSSKMTYAELKQYIADLQKAGFEVDQLRTELYKKFSFPVVNLIMTVLGIPFAFSMGRRGGLYGVAAGVLLGILYWGAFGVFGVMGASGLLAPILAAWGPNILFSAAGLLMLSGIKT